LSEATGAPIIGCAPLVLESIGPRADASFDKQYAPDKVLADGDTIEFDGGRMLIAVATPGHTSNHLCFAFNDALFTGDHVMGWSTTVVVPPDGDMGAYMKSLELLRQRGDRIFYPAHGPAVTKPTQLVRGMIGHRLQRERQIMRLVGERSRDIFDIVANAYPGLDQRLVPAAGGSVLAHLLDLQKRGLVGAGEGETWTKTAEA
jgi:glyoxylase-like metal-dependent hydrolase (beta-lactamase superfamily II)